MAPVGVVWDATALPSVAPGLGMTRFLPGRSLPPALLLCGAARGLLSVSRTSSRFALSHEAPFRVLFTKSVQEWSLLRVVQPKRRVALQRAVLQPNPDGGGAAQVRRRRSGCTTSRFVVPHGILNCRSCLDFLNATRPRQIGVTGVCVKGPGRSQD
ncbi:hypothetical protein MTO96_011688 [Rhipicephalus appendiculatus]